MDPPHHHHHHHHHHQQRLYDCLAASPELSASSIVIEDLSRWYATRAMLGPRRHSARIVKRVDATTTPITVIPSRLRLRTGEIYSASIFDVDVRTGKIAKMQVGFYASAIQAHRASKEAQDARDERLLDSSKPPTHLKVKIISASLKDLSHTQRIETIHKILLHEYNRPSATGSAVARLPHLQSLPKALPFELLVELREGEVDMAPAGVLTELHVPNSVQIARATIASSKNPILHGMSPKLRQLAMSEYQKSSALAMGRPEMATTKRKANTSTASKPKLVNQKKNPLRRRQDNTVETEVATKLAISALKLSESAMHMQRMWRRRHFPRMQKRWARINRAALDIQRVFRASRGKQSAQDWRRSRDLAVVTLQRRFRRHQLTRLATLTQTATRGWIARRYLNWMIANAETAITIQRVARGFLGRCLYRQALCEKEILLRHRAVTLIQALGRMHIQRSRYLIMLLEKYRQTVELPRIIQIQAFWRMCAATSLLHRLQGEGNAATTIQRHARGSSIRRIIQAYRYSVFRHKSATMIQSIVRGFLDRCFVGRIKRKRYYLSVVIPSLVSIQSVYRGFKERLRQNSAKTIQDAYRRSKSRQISRGKWLRYVSMLKQRSALMIQTWFRSRSARHRYLSLLDFERSRRLCASRTILCAWRHYKSREEYLLKKEALEFKRSQDTIIALQMEQESIRSTTKSIADDIEANRVAGEEAAKRLKVLNGQFAEATSLVGVVESDDVFFSEPEADAERSRLQLQLRDVTDSIASCKDVIKTSRRNIARLQIQRDKLYVNDLDRLCCFEHEEHEKQRKAELRRCMARKEREWRERVRFERMKWAVKLPGELAKKGQQDKSQSLDMAFHRSVSTTKRREILQKHIQRLNEEAQKKTDEAMRRRHQNGADNKAVRDLYNRIFRNMQSIMKS